MFSFRKKTKKIISLLLCICLMVGMVPGEIFAANNIQINIEDYPDIDVVLAKSKTATDTSNFKNDIINKLKSLGVPESKVNVMDVEATTSTITQEGAQHILDTWYNYPGANIANYYAAGWTVKNGTLTTTENVNWTGFLNWNEDAKNTQDASFEFNLTLGSHSDPQGWTFCTTKNDDGTYSFYALEINHRYGKANLACIQKWIPASGYPTHGGPFYHGAVGAQDGDYDGTLKYVGHQGTTGYTIAQADIGKKTSYHVKIERVQKNIKVYVDNVLKINVNNAELMSGTYGPYTVSQYEAVFSNISVKSEIVKNFTEILNAPKWRDNALHFVVNVEDTTNPSFQTDIEKLLSKTINDKIHFISWGTTTNQNMMEGFIEQNNGNGVFVYNGDYNNAINSTANYIKSLLRQQSQGSELVVLNNQISLSVNPASAATNTAGGIYPDGRWLIEHDPYYYANPIGQYVKGGVRTSDLSISKFDKTGKYDIKYEEDLIKTIFVHRMPVAQFSLTVKDNVVSTHSVSYDLDSTEDIGLGQGIKSEQWSYKVSGNDNWIIGKLDRVQAGKDYVIQLKVTDFQGQESAPITKYVSGSSEYVNPVADFNFSSPQISKYGSLTINDSSYDPKGVAITQREWTVIKDGTQIYSGGTTPNINFINYGTGNYTYKLRVKNSNNLWSEIYTRVITIIDDEMAPEVEINPQSGDWALSHSINIKLIDNDSKLNKYRYAFSNSAAIPSTGWSSYISLGGASQYNASVKVENNGQYYLHVEVFDIAGNKSNISRGLFKIDKIKPQIIANLKNGKSGALTTNTDTKIDLTITDNESGVKYLEYKLPGQSSYTKLADNVKQFNISSELSGIISIFAYDKLGNKSNEYIINDLIIDKTKPVISSHSSEILSNPLLRSRIITNKQVKITLTTSDNLSGVKYLEYKLPGQSSYTKLADGVNNFTVQESITGPISVFAYDNAGNKSNEYIINDITTETTAPSLSITSNIPAWYNTNATININTTDTNGINNVSYNLKNLQGTSVKNGTITIDSSGNGNITLTDEGKYTLDLNSVDNAGNSKTLNGTAINIDKTKPVINSYIPTITSNPLLRSVITNKQIKIDLNISDNLSGFNYFEYKLPGETSYKRDTGTSFTISESLKGTISIFAYDIAGNKSEEFLITDIIAETVAPSIVITSRIPEWFTTDANVNIVSTDENGIKSLAYTLKDKTQVNTVDSGNLTVNFSENSTYKYATEGEYVLDLTLTDNAGNTSTLNGTKINIDKTSPVMGNAKIEEMPSLLRSRIITNKQVKVSFPDISDNLSGFDYMKYKLPGNVDYTVLNTGIKEFIIDSAINGEISVIAFDKAGNQSETKINNIITESNPPLLSIDKSSLLPWYNENSLLPSFPINVSDDNGLSSVVYTVYTTNNDKVISDKPITIINNEGNIDVSNDGQWLPDGNYRVEVIVTDMAGNKTSDNSLEINIDKTKPTINAPSPDSNYLKNQSEINVRADDNLSGVKEFYYNYKNKTNLSNGDMISISDTGVYDVVITAIDNAGNKSTAIRTFKVDNELPIIDNYSFIEAPATFSMTTSSPVRVMVQSHDNHSLVDYLEYSEDNNNYKKMEEENISGNNYYGYFDVDKEWIGNIYVRAVDKVGNISDVFTIGDLIIDRTPPVLTVDEVSGWHNEDININVNATDGIEMKEFYYQINNGEKINIDTDSIVMTMEGDYELKITATDTSDNSSYATRHIQLDKTKPVITSHTFKEHEMPMLLSSDITYSNKIISVNMDIFDELSLIDKFEFKLPISETWNNGTMVVKDNLYKFTVADEINGTILVKAYDKAGNVSETYEITDLVIDKTPPEIIIDNPPSSDFWINSYTANSLDINISSNDALDEVARTQWFMYKNDAENPIIGGNFDENLISLNPEDFSEGDGIYTVIVNAWDNTGNVTSKSFTVQVDKTNSEIGGILYDSILDRKPELNYEVSATGVRVYTSASDNFSGVNEVYCSTDNENWIEVNKNNNNFYCYDIAFEENEEFDGTVIFKVIDIAGNEELFESERIVVDKTAPSISVSKIDENKWYNQDITYTVNIMDEYLYSLRYETDEPSERQQIGTFDLYEEGQSVLAKEITMRNNGLYYLNVYVMDTSEHEESDTSLVKIDKIKPIIADVITEIVPPFPGNIVNEEVITNGTIKVSVNAEDVQENDEEISEINHLEYRTSDMEESLWIPIDGYEFSYSDIYKGKLSIRAIDNAGNISDIKDSTDVNIERTKPELIIEHPEPGIWYTEPVDINIKVEDLDSDIDVVMVTYEDIYGEYHNETIDLINYEGVFTATIDGEYDIFVKVYDLAGNISSETVHVMLDQALQWDAPEVNSNDYIFDEWSIEPVNINFFYYPESIPISGLKEFKFDINNNSNINTTGDAIFDTDGIYTMKVKGITNALLDSIESEYVVMVDITKPVINGIYVEGKLLNGGEHFNLGTQLEIKASDNLSDIKQYEYRVDDGEWIVLESNILTVDSEYTGNIEFRVLDNAGNYSAPYQIKGFTMDYTNPVFTFEDVQKDVIMMKASEPIHRGHLGYVRFFDLDGNKIRSIYISNNRIKVSGEYFYIDIADLIPSGTYRMILDENIAFDFAGNQSVEYDEIININTANKAIFSGASAIIKDKENIEATLNKASRNYQIVLPYDTEDFILLPRFTENINTIESDMGTINGTQISLNAKDFNNGDVITITANEEITKVIIYKAEYKVEIETSGDIKASIDEGEVKGAIDIENDLQRDIKNIKVVVNVETQNPEDVPSDMDVVNNLSTASEQLLSNPIDISVYKYLGDNIELIKNLQNDITISIELSENMLDRQWYKIIRIHDGEADILNAEINGIDLLFNSDRFSTYFILAGPENPHFTIPDEDFDEPRNERPRKDPIKFEDVDNYNFLVPYVVFNSEMILEPISKPIEDLHKIIYKPSYTGEYKLTYNPKYFYDVDVSSWAKRSIDFLAAREVIQGLPDGSFAGTRQITRAEIAAILIRLNGPQKHTPKNYFHDIPSDAWYTPYVNDAYEYGIATGVGNNNFAPNRNITRQELAVMIYNMMGRPDVLGTVDYYDKNDIAEWAQDAVIYLTKHGIIQGNNNEFNPNGYATRYESAEMIRKLIEFIVNNSDKQEIKVFEGSVDF